jgi:hypothetical protein
MSHHQALFLNHIRLQRNSAHLGSQGFKKLLDSLIVIQFRVVTYTAGMVFLLFSMYLAIFEIMDYMVNGVILCRLN